MRKSKTDVILQLIVLIPFLSVLIQAIQPQDLNKKRRIDIEWADFYNYDAKVKANAQRLIGHVRLKHNDVLMFCDSAYQYNDTNMVDAFGNVHIVQGDTLNLYGNKINYNGNSKLAKVLGNVKLIDKSITLTTDALDFDLANNIGNYSTGGKIVDTANVLTSIIGKYYSNDNLFFFKDSVVLVNKDFVLRADTLKYNSHTEIAFIVGPTTITSTTNDGVLYSENGWYDTRKHISELYKASKFTNKNQILEGDTLFYERATGNGMGKHKVTLTDTTSKVVIKGKYGIYNEKSKRAFVTDSAVFIQYGKQDTLYMHADTLQTKPDTTMVKKDTSDVNKKDAKFFMAFRKVRFYKTDLQGECDSLSYQMKDSTIYMFYDPVLWSKKNQMTAEKIQYISKNPDPDIAKLEKNAFIIMSEDSVRFNQISGKLIVGQIFDNKLRYADVNGNAQTLYYLKDNNKFTGMNRLTSSKIKIHLKENQIDTIRFYPKPEGRTTPMKELKPLDTRLGGFVWRESERPLSQEDLYPIDQKRKKNAGPKLKPASK
jgi:lipopolysaccharide export system protein LptA